MPRSLVTFVGLESHLFNWIGMSWHIWKSLLSAPSRRCIVLQVEQLRFDLAALAVTQACLSVYPFVVFACFSYQLAAIKRV